MKKYLIIDKFTISRESIASLIYEIESDSVVYEASSIQEAKNLIEFYKSIDYIIFNPTYSQIKDGDYMTQLNRFNTVANKLIISHSNDASFLDELLKKGADATVVITSSRNEICAAIRSLKTKNAYVDQSVIRNNDSSQEIKQKSDEDRDCANNMSDKLTARQKEVLDYMTKGYANKLIAYELGVSEGTIKLHVSSILRALKVTNRTEAALQAGQFLQSHAH